MSRARDRARPWDPSLTVAGLVHERLDALSVSERRVARTLLARYPMAGLESMMRLAEEAGVAGPTVLRFARKLGFGGYPDLQRTLRAEVQARFESPLTLYGVQTLRPEEPVVDRSLQVLRRGLEKTFSAVSPQVFNAVVALLTDQRRTIWLTGGRFSQLIAHYLYRQLRMVRSRCSLVGATFDPRIEELIDVGRGDVVCVFDYRRYQDDTVAFARQAAARGAVVVLFTDPWLSPAAEVARHILISHPDSPSPFDSMVGGFALAETVLAGVVARLGERGRARVEELEAARRDPAWADADRGTAVRSARPRRTRRRDGSD